MKLIIVLTLAILRLATGKYCKITYGELSNVMLNKFSIENQNHPFDSVSELRRLEIKNIQSGIITLTYLDDGEWRTLEMPYYKYDKVKCKVIVEPSRGYRAAVCQFKFISFSPFFFQINKLKFWLAYDDGYTSCKNQLNEALENNQACGISDVEKPYQILSIPLNDERTGFINFDTEDMKFKLNHGEGLTTNVDAKIHLTPAGGELILVKLDSKEESQIVTFKKANSCFSLLQQIQKYLDREFIPNTVKFGYYNLYVIDLDGKQLFSKQLNQKRNNSFIQGLTTEENINLENSDSIVADGLEKSFTNAKIGERKLLTESIIDTLDSPRKDDLEESFTISNEEAQELTTEGIINLGNLNSIKIGSLKNSFTVANYQTAQGLHLQDYEKNQLNLVLRDEQNSQHLYDLFVNFKSEEHFNEYMNKLKAKFEMCKENTFYYYKYHDYQNPKKYHKDVLNLLTFDTKNGRVHDEKGTIQIYDMEMEYDESINSNRLFIKGVEIYIKNGNEMEGRIVNKYYQTRIENSIKLLKNIEARLCEFFKNKLTGEEKLFYFWTPYDSNQVEAGGAAKLRNGKLRDVGKIKIIDNHIVINWEEFLFEQLKINEKLNALVTVDKSGKEKIYYLNHCTECLKQIKDLQLNALEWMYYKIQKEATYLKTKILKPNPDEESEDESSGEPEGDGCVIMLETKASPSNNNRKRFMLKRK
jgi:hypothetical protein